MTRAPRQGAVLCVGRVYCDVVFTGLARLPTPGTEIFADGLQLRAGGGAFTTAAYLAALGERASLATFLPAPPFDKLVAADIAAAGIENSACRPAVSAADPQLTCALVGAGDRAFITRRSGPATPQLDQDLPERLGLAHLHLGELSTLVEAPWLADFARGAGLTLSLDCGWDESLAAADAAAAIAAVDVFLPNSEERAWLDGLGIRPGTGPLWVEKRGAEGSALLGTPKLAVPAERLRPIDPTGAGDAFNAGFLQRWLAAAPLEECLRAGNECGGVAVQCLGGFDPARVPGRLAEIAGETTR